VSRIYPNVLFLSAEKSHTNMFLNVAFELDRVSNGLARTTILNTEALSGIPFGLNVNFKQQLEQMEDLLEKSKASILVVGNDQGVYSSFITLCNLKGIPSLAIQDGILTDIKAKGISYFLSWRGYLPWRIISLVLNNRAVARFFVFIGRQWAVPCWGLSSVSKIAVMGEYYKRVFINRRVSPERLVVTGYPLLDDVVKHRLKFNRLKVFEDLGLFTNKPLVLLITQPFVEDGLWHSKVRDLFLQSVVSNVARLKGQLVIKVHPRENLEFYVRKIGDQPGVIVLLASDVVITVSSTVGLWALAYRKPVLLLTCFPCGAENILARLALCVNNLGDFPAMLDQLMTCRAENNWNELSGEFLDHLYRLDGRANERIAKLILSMIK
jgi:hypothetical protein